MQFTKNLILAICLIFSPGKQGNVLFIKPSVYLMPEMIFTNQANFELVKRYQVKKAFPVCVNIYDGNNTLIRQGDFRIKMPFPDLIAILNKKSKEKYTVKGYPWRFNIENAPLSIRKSGKVHPVL